jgi:hypothetical protein
MGFGDSLSHILSLLGVAVTKGKIWGYWAGFARPIPPIFFLTTAIPRDTDFEQQDSYGIIFLSVFFILLISVLIYAS